MLPQLLRAAKLAEAATFVIVSTVSPVFVSVTICGRPDVPTYWLGKVTLGGEKLIPITPTPLRSTVCGLPAALSVTCSFAVRGPMSKGVKVTLIPQALCGGSDKGQLLLWAKSPLSAPIIWIDVMTSGTWLVLLRVAPCELLVVPRVWMPKLRLGGEIVAAGCAPVPESGTIWGLPWPLSEIVNVPFCGPTEVGVNVTLIRQLPPGGRTVAQLFVWANGAVATIELMFSVPSVLSITVCGWLVIPTVW